MTEDSRTLGAPYRGRFAPSPTGPLHFGSLVTALGSYLQARSQKGEWLVRVEDLDPPREMTGATDDILRTLEAYQLHWDGPLIYQSTRHEAYAEALAQLSAAQQTFPCGCSRKTIAEASKKSGGRIYPGTCRGGLAPGTSARSIRVRAPDQSIQFTDSLQGPQSTPLDKSVGDFIIRRADGLYAYHLAVVVDDAFQGISEIVRGTDLLQETPPQAYLQALLGYPTPRYAHLPMAVNAQGEKLSKHTHAPAIERKHPGPTLFKALAFLGHPPDATVNRENPRELLDWAVSHWNIQQVPKQHMIEA